MPAGILSDMIQQYKAIFEGEPIELTEEEVRRQATAEAARSDASGVDLDRHLDNAQFRDSERQKRGNRNSMIYATNSDVMLNSVGRELTGMWPMDLRSDLCTDQLPFVITAQTPEMQMNQTEARL
jgi:hypothetical protein